MLDSKEKFGLVSALVVLMLFAGMLGFMAHTSKQSNLRRPKECADLCEFQHKGTGKIYRGRCFCAEGDLHGHDLR